MREFIKKSVGSLLVLLPFILSGQALRINEVVSANLNGYEDEDGDRSDWIEIFNTSDTPVSLSGYGLSDDPQDPYEWVFSGGQIDPHDFMVVFASGKDRQEADLSWQLMAGVGTEWQYFIGDTEPAGNWNTQLFDDSHWITGSAGIGYGDGDDQTIISETLSLYMRFAFNISDPIERERPLFHIDFDDGYIAYLNGVEFSRKNLGETGTYVAHNATATTYTEPVLPYGGTLPAILIPPELMQTGANVLAIQVHNSGLNSSDLTALPFLSRSGGSAVPTDLPNYLELPPAHMNHSNFRVSKGGETLSLTSADRTQVDTLQVPALPTDISYGRYPDGDATSQYFGQPTPGAANTNGSSTLITSPSLDPVPGFFQGPVRIDPGDIPGGVRYTYTLDGTQPTLNSTPLIAPIDIYETSVLRILASSLDGAFQDQSTFSYFIGEAPNLPVISLTFEPDDFFDIDSGLYVPGRHASEDFPHFGANFWEDWEREVHLEYFENGQSLSYAAHAGAKIFGGWSRGFPQKSLALYARRQYGDSDFSYPFFREHELDSFEALVLRNSGNDWEHTGFRDRMMTGLVRQRGIERQAYQAVEVYFNGDFWGVYNLREKINEHFIASHFDISPDDIDLLEGYAGWRAMHGSDASYHDLLDYIDAHDLSDPLAYEYVRERIDIQNFIDYQLSQIYFDNRDWPGNNIKFWRQRSVGGKWRWILYDTDFGFGIWDPHAYSFNTLEFATESNGPHWPNPPWSTFLLRKLLENQDFRDDFIMTACDLLNGTFLPEVVADSIQANRDVFIESMPAHFERWGQNDMENWLAKIETLLNFGNNRPSHFRDDLQAYFQLGALNQVTLAALPAGSGDIQIHSLIPEKYPWSGQYYSRIPLTLKAIPQPGYVFSHWTGSTSKESEISVILGSDVNFIAHFVSMTAEPELVINEINYHSPDADDSGDWLELVNAGETSVNLSGWRISDGNDDNNFELGEQQLEPGNYIVAVHDSLLFRAVHGDQVRIVGNIDFNFSNGGELVRLFDHEGTLVDSVRYDDAPPWPTAPDGTGPTLELLHYYLDNGEASAWTTSAGLGTPGRENSQFTVATVEPASPLPSELRISQTFPNPTNSFATITYELPRAGETHIQIFDIRGALIYSHQQQESEAGIYSYMWNGRQGNGEACASGMYIVRVAQQHEHATAKLVIVR